ncbi:MAG: heavy metal translocating P-type ATPase metal-binding domain-containing protein [Calditrichaeota bacterium]|nr:heavy metal translocating P-type ATPase metal-binding domain-containing protein [Calditrichota bacterium]MCB9368923.1 heavy metal translocating P-type ATPase metal-binding domain-containing protein [Calditrichota bacterium]
MPVPPARQVESGDAFCCAGCEAVYAILHESDLDEYYAMRDRLGAEKTGPARVSGKAFDYFDDPEFLKRYAEPRSEGLLSVRFYLEGVHCAACSWLVEKVLLEREGAAYAQLDMGRNIVEIVFDPVHARLSKFARALDRFGYTPHPLVEDSVAQARKKETRSLLLRMGVAGAVAGNIMLLAAALYAGEFTGIDTDLANLFRWVSFGLALPAVLYSALPFYRGAISGLRAGMLHMDLPISLGILAAMSVSVAATVQSRGEVYFDTLSILIFLLLVGRMLLSRATARAADSAESLMEQAPRRVRRETNGKVEEIELAAADAGDALLFLPGDVVAVDGVALQGGWVTEAHLSGESDSVWKEIGATVYAGSQVVSVPLRLQATAVGAFTRLAQFSEMIRKAAASRAPIVKLHDKIAGYFVATVLTLAAVTAIIWWQIDPARVPWNVAALLVITCPCALGLATPVALSIAMGRAAKRGIYIKTSDALERASTVRHALLDKTGTLTSGKTELVASKFARDLTPCEQDKLMAQVAVLESYSTHPVGQALKRIESPDFDVSDVVVHAQGISGSVAGDRLAVGSRRFLRDMECLDGALSADCDGNVFVARNGKIVACLLVADPISKDAQHAVDALRKRKIAVELLSGDRAAEVARVAGALGIVSARGDVTPEDKLARVAELEASGTHTAMFGDGVNDAAALSRATVGVSAAEAADIARSAADVFVSRRGPIAFAELVSLSTNTMRTIRRNVVIAICYNAIGAGLAMAGLVSPLLAALLMPASSITVLTLAVRGSKP